MRTRTHTECNCYVCAGAHSVSNMTDHSETAIQMCLHRHCTPCSQTALWVNEPTLSALPLTTIHSYFYSFDFSSWNMSTLLIDRISFLNRHLSNVRTDKCLEVNHGRGSRESDVGSVIVLCSVPPEKTMWWSALVTLVFLRWHKNKEQSVTVIRGSPVRRLHWVLLSLRSRHKLKR